MKALDSPFTKIINGTTQFVIPVFQRDYTWDAETQCAQLWRERWKNAISRLKRTAKPSGGIAISMMCGNSRSVRTFY